MDDPLSPHFKNYGKRPDIVAFVDRVTAPAIGVIAGAVMVIEQRSIADWISGPHA